MLRPMTMRLRVFVLAALLAASSAGCGGQEPEAASAVPSNQPSTDAVTEPDAQTERVTITFDPAAYTARTEAEVMECLGCPALLTPDSVRVSRQSWGER